MSGILKEYRQEVVEKVGFLNYIRRLGEDCIREIVPTYHLMKSDYIFYPLFVLACTLEPVPNTLGKCLHRIFS